MQREGFERALRLAASCSAVIAMGCTAIGPAQPPPAPARPVTTPKITPVPALAREAPKEMERETVRYLDAPWVSLKPVLISDKLVPLQARRWQVLTADVTLAKTVERWAKTAGYRLKWDATRNFLIRKPSVFDDIDFEAALGQVLFSSEIQQSEYPLEACVYESAPPLVRVTRLGEQTKECAGGTNARQEPVRYIGQPRVLLKTVEQAVPTPATPLVTPAPERWEVQIADGTLSRALTRWADVEGLQLVWDAPLDKPAMRASYEGSFETAVEKLMIDTKATGYELHACAYANAIRILHVSQICKR